VSPLKGMRLGNPIHHSRVEINPLWEGEEVRGSFSEKRDVCCSIMGSITSTFYY